MIFHVIASFKRICINDVGAETDEVFGLKKKEWLIMNPNPDLC